MLSTTPVAAFRDRSSSLPLISFSSEPLDAEDHPELPLISFSSLTDNKNGKSLLTVNKNGGSLPILSSLPDQDSPLITAKIYNCSLIVFSLIFVASLSIFLILLFLENLPLTSIYVVITLIILLGSILGITITVLLNCIKIYSKPALLQVNPTTLEEVGSKAELSHEYPVDLLPSEQEEKEKSTEEEAPVVKEEKTLRNRIFKRIQDQVSIMEKSFLFISNKYNSVIGLKLLVEQLKCLLNKKEMSGLNARILEKLCYSSKTLCNISTSLGQERDNDPLTLFVLLLKEVNELSTLLQYIKTSTQCSPSFIRCLEEALEAAKTIKISKSRLA